MTTRIIIQPHCGPDKEVAVVTEDGATSKQVLLTDGESHELYVYDSRRVTVFERRREQPPLPAPAAERCEHGMYRTYCNTCRHVAPMSGASPG